jgi:hypothetical protein
MPQASVRLIMPPVRMRATAMEQMKRATAMK